MVAQIEILGYMICNLIALANGDLVLNEFRRGNGWGRKWWSLGVV